MIRLLFIQISRIEMVGAGCVSKKVGSFTNKYMTVMLAETWGKFWLTVSFY